MACRTVEESADAPGNDRSGDGTGWLVQMRQAGQIIARLEHGWVHQRRQLRCPWIAVEGADGGVDGLGLDDQSELKKRATTTAAACGRPWQLLRQGGPGNSRNGNDDGRREQPRLQKGLKAVFGRRRLRTATAGKEKNSLRHCPDGKPGVSCRRRPTFALPPKAPSLDRGPAAMPVYRLRKTRTCRWRRETGVPCREEDAGVVDRWRRETGRGVSAEDGEGGLRVRNRAQPQRTLERGDREHSPRWASRSGTGRIDGEKTNTVRRKSNRSGTNDGLVEKLKKKLMATDLMKRRQFYGEIEGVRTLCSVPCHASCKARYLMAGIALPERGRAAGPCTSSARKPHPTPQRHRSRPRSSRLWPNSGLRHARLHR
jgi:hypothetical protein